jgi:hypothetical protein
MLCQIRYIIWVIQIEVNGIIIRYNRISRVNGKK